MAFESRLQGFQRRTRSELIGRGFARMGRQAFAGLRGMVAWIASSRLTGLRAGLAAPGATGAASVTARRVKPASAEAAARLRADMVQYISDGRCGSYDGFLRNYDKRGVPGEKCPPEQLTEFIREDSEGAFSAFGQQALARINRQWKAVEGDRFGEDRLVLEAIDQALDASGSTPLLGMATGTLLGSLAQDVREGRARLTDYLHSDSSGRDFDESQVRDDLAAKLVSSALFNRGLCLTLYALPGDRNRVGRLAQTVQSLATPEALASTLRKKWEGLPEAQRAQLQAMAQALYAKIHARIAQMLVPLPTSRAVGEDHKGAA